MPQPVFSVMMITYNHEKFIEQAVNSILAQQFDGALEIVIGVDKSSDGTLDKCRQLKEVHREAEIILLEHERNVGMYQNFVEVLKLCRGQYIAILEGDDFWTDPRKLSIQYNYFESHRSCIISGGLIDTVDENGRLVKRAKTVFVGGRGKRIGKPDLLLANRYSTLTMAFRRNKINWGKLDRLRSSPHLDWPFFVSLDYATGEYGYLFNKVFGAYRQHGGGVYSNIATEKRIINTAKTVYWINQIEGHSSKGQEYLQLLFSNLLREKGYDLESPYRSWFDPNLIVFDNQLIKKSYLARISKLASRYLFLGGQHRFSFKSSAELIRQTRLSNKAYLQLIANPIIVLAALKNKISTIFS